MTIEAFEQTKDIRERVLLAIRAAEKMPDDLLFHCQINDRYIADILKICIQKNDSEDNSKEEIFDALKEYFLKWKHNKVFQAALLSCAGIKRTDRDFYLQSTFKDYQKYVFEGTCNGMNSAQVEIVLPESVEMKSGITGISPEEVIFGYQNGLLGFKTLLISFWEWLFFKIRRRKSAK